MSEKVAPESTPKSTAWPNLIGLALLVLSTGFLLYKALDATAGGDFWTPATFGAFLWQILGVLWFLYGAATRR